MSSRKYAIVILGATGFTGQLIAHYFAERIKDSQDHALQPSQVALAGRSLSKLESLSASIAQETGIRFPLVQIDTEDAKAVDQVVSETRVVLTTVGPYAKYGTSVVDACVKNGTHYCDLTGEPQWVAKMIAKHHENAQKNQCLIVNCCGFDSIPSDLGVFYLVDYARKKYNTGLKTVTGSVTASGGASGGTIASIINMIESSTWKELQDANDPYLLNPVSDTQYPPKGKVDPADAPALAPVYDPILKVFGAIWLMAAINEKVVRRSSCLYKIAGLNYGKNFHYRELLSTNSFFLGLIINFGIFLGVLLLAFPPTRWLIKKYVPQSGEGPSKEQRDKSLFILNISSELEGKSQAVVARVKGGDPGYGATSKMVSESAIILATQYKNLKIKGGFVTPSFAFGSLLIERLQKAGITFEITQG